MGFTLRNVRDRILETLRTRIPSLPKRLKKLRLPRWALLVPAALILAAWAHSGSRSEGKMSWLAANPPSASAWRDLVLRRGFAPLEDPAWREKAYAEMPENSRAKASAYLSEDHHTLAIREAGDWLYYELKNAPGIARPGAVVSRELWENLGVGWEAYSAFEAAALPILRTAENPVKKAGPWRDPRSIEY